MRKILLSLSALALSAGMASAGAMVAPTVEPMVPAPAPTIARAYDWTGGYAGLGLTYGRASYSARFADDDEADNGANEAWPSGSGWGIGGFAGFNWQSGNMVYGVEGHLSGHRMRGSTDIVDDGVGVGVRTNVRGMASLRGRIGIAQDRTMFFLTAGPAMASVRHSLTVTVDNESLEVSDRKTVNGFVIGAGIEHAMAGGWNIRGDLEHHRFRGRGFYDVDGDGPAFTSVRTRVNLARVSAVFRF
jgi:outer membrane immunogenic protein